MQADHHAQAVCHRARLHRADTQLPRRRDHRDQLTLPVLLHREVVHGIVPDPHRLRGVASQARDHRAQEVHSPHREVVVVVRVQAALREVAADAEEDKEFRFSR